MVEPIIAEREVITIEVGDPIDPFVAMQADGDL